MRNSVIILGLLVCLSFKIQICKAQLIDNKINFYAGYQIGMFHGKKQVHDGNFLFPAFYSNLNNINGLSAKALYNGHQYISYGIGLTHSNASDWEYDSNQDYLESKVEMSSLAVIIQFHNKFLQCGIFNRCKFFVEISPMIGVSNFTSFKQLFNIQDSSDIISAPTKSNDIFYGFNGNAGIECALSQSTGLVISYSLQHSWVTSILYSDTHFTASQLNVGIMFKLMKDKRFLYKN